MLFFGISRLGASSLLKKWKEGVRSKFSDYDFREKTIVSPKIGPDPDLFNRLLAPVSDSLTGG